PPRSPPNRIESRNRTMKTTKTIFAMPAAAPAIPPNPSAAATSAITSSDMTRPNIGLFLRSPKSQLGERSRVPVMSGSDLIGIVFRGECKQARDHDDGKDRLNLQFRVVNCSCNLLTKLVELIEKRDRSIHCWALNRPPA